MPKRGKAANPEDIAQPVDESTVQESIPKEEDESEHSSDEEAEDYSDGTLEDTTNNPQRRQDTTAKKPTGRAKTLPAYKAPLLTKPECYLSWKARFLSFCFSIEPRYRQILEGLAVGNVSHEDQIYNALTSAVADVTEARQIVGVLAGTTLANKGTKAWKFLEQRYDRVSESKVQRLLDAHRRGQGNNESMPSYLQRYQVQHEELKQLGHPHTERTTASSMVDGLRAEYRDIKQYFRIHRRDLDDLCETVETCLELYDCRLSDSYDKNENRRSSGYNNTNQNGNRRNNNAGSTSSNPGPGHTGSAAHVADSTRSKPKTNPRHSSTAENKAGSGSNADSSEAGGSKFVPKCQFCKQKGH